MPLEEQFNSSLKTYIDASDHYTLASIARFTVMNDVSSTPGAKAEAAAVQGEAEDELRRCIDRVSVALALDVPSDPGLKAFIAAFDAEEAARTPIDPTWIADDEAPAARARCGCRRQGRSARRSGDRLCSVRANRRLTDD
jgi:hypothetical protein